MSTEFPKAVLKLGAYTPRQRCCWRKLAPDEREGSSDASNDALAGVRQRAVEVEEDGFELGQSRRLAD